MLRVLCMALNSDRIRFDVATAYGFCVSVWPFTLVVFVYKCIYIYCIVKTTFVVKKMIHKIQLKFMNYDLTKGTMTNVFWNENLVCSMHQIILKITEYLS